MEIIVIFMWFLEESSPSRIEVSCPFISVFISNSNIWELRPLLSHLLHLMILTWSFSMEIIVVLMWFLIVTSPSWIIMSCPPICIFIPFSNIWELRPLRLFSIQLNKISFIFMGKKSIVFDSLSFIPCFTLFNW